MLQNSCSCGSQLLYLYKPYFIMKDYGETKRRNEFESHQLISQTLFVLFCFTESLTRPGKKMSEIIETKTRKLINETRNMGGKASNLEPYLRICCLHIQFLNWTLSNKIGLAMRGSWCHHQQTHIKTYKQRLYLRLCFLLLFSIFLVKLWSLSFSF